MNMSASQQLLYRRTREGVEAREDIEVITNWLMVRETNFFFAVSRHAMRSMYVLVHICTLNKNGIFNVIYKSTRAGFLSVSGYPCLIS